MAKWARFSLAFLVISSAPAAPENRPLTVLFGPAAEAPSQTAVPAVAAAAIEWLKSPGATVELRRPGISDGQELTKYTQPKDIEKALLDAARTGRESDLMAFVNALDRAASATSRRPGKRVLIAVLESPSPALAAAMKGGPQEFDNRLAQTLEFCKTHSVSVIVIDPADPSRDTAAALKALASGSGGALIRNPETLGANISRIAPVEKAQESEAVKSSPVGPPALTVRAQYFRIYPTRSKPTSELGPMNGFLLVEAPLAALEFQTDERSYAARARITQAVRNAQGKVVWQARKEITVKGPIRNLAERRKGNICYLRELKLPGGLYALEGTVEDLVSGKSAQAAEALRATDSLPGFALSDAMFVRKLDDSVDKFEADQVLSYDGTALAPILDPVFPADERTDLQLYFIIYPDYRGAQPRISLEIRRDGQPVGRSEIPFRDSIRSASGEGSGMDATSEQKHEFPFMAGILGASFEQGRYEAHLTVRQGDNSVTRIVPFRVIGK